jgi:hypothetical protein
MPSNKLEAVKQKYPALARQIDDVIGYLSVQQQKGTNFFLPKLVAAKLKTNEASALGLLSLLEEEGILTHEYHVLCKATGALISTVSSLRDLDETYQCDYCGKDHSQENEVEVQLVFKPLELGGNREHAA